VSLLSCSSFCCGRDCEVDAFSSSAKRARSKRTPLTGRATQRSRFSVSRLLSFGAAAAALSAFAPPAYAATAAAAPTVTPVYVFGIPVDFILFGLTLLGVAIFHHKVLQVALTGLAAIVIYKLLFTGFKFGTGLAGLALHMQHEAVILANLFLLLMGFALLSRHFENSQVPDAMPAILPDGWQGGLSLLAVVFVLSGFLDNIAAALIGGAMARHVFKGKVHIGYLAAIVAASNAGGAGSVVGDTTTTMMWIDGISPLTVLSAYVAAIAAFFVFAIPAAIQQHRHSPILKDPSHSVTIDKPSLVIVAMILVFAIAANVTANLKFPAILDVVPVIGLAVWVVLLLTAGWRRPDWAIMPETFKGTIFLLALVTCASLMPVEELPLASWQTALGLGFLSSVFDNIPLTALAIKQGGYDWGMLAFTVGFGGSMIWFGSSAGVAISNMYPEAKSVGRWVRHGWPVIIGYVVGFFVMLALLGWNPDPPHKKRVDLPSIQMTTGEVQWS
jgi:Na+/H+ antiporter NhaD/arsenite permease-like protein